MFEKVNPSHPDKLADRIAGAIVDLAYETEDNPKIAVEVLIGHGICHIIAESSVDISKDSVRKIVSRIVDDTTVDFVLVQQDKHLSDNQKSGFRCGDNGIFKGVPVTEEQRTLSFIVKDLYAKHPSDGKYILADEKLIACQSCVDSMCLKGEINAAYNIDEGDVVVNPLGDWTGGTEVDTGATNRKLGSDMGDSVTGGGLHGKDLSKADVSVNIYAFLKAQKLGVPVEIHCAIGDEIVDGKPYSEVVNIARKYINNRGGFERFAEWGLI